jgi:hypothetical protein
MAQADPEYANDESRMWVERMIEAHGGMERWEAIGALRFDNIMYNNVASEGAYPWWVYNEVVEHHGARRARLDWVLEGAVTAYDGEQAWSTNYRRLNQPIFMAHFFHYFVNLPWLTQEDGVVLSEPSVITWPGTDREMIRIQMDYEQAPTVGKTELDYYVLLIDPESHLLVGYQYAIAYGAMLDVMNVPDHLDVFGPMWRMNLSFTEVDGLIFPSAAVTKPYGEGRTAGTHLMLNYVIEPEFDPAWSRMPEGAVIDESSDERAP